MSKRKKDEDKINVGNNSGNVGYSQKALAALDTGSYGTITNRKPKATTSSSQITITKTIPVLNGATSSTTISTSPTASNVSTYTGAQPVSVTKNSSRTDTSISTTRARQNYSQNHKPIGRSLTKKDSDIVYNAALKMLNNNMTAQEAAEEMRSGRSQTASGMTQAYVKNKNWEKEYGKSFETLIEEFAKDDKSIQRKSQEIGERGGKVGKTAGSVYMNAYLKPVTGAKATISNLINPNSEKAKNADKMARAVSDVSKSARESTTRDMGTVGKTVYNLGTSAADRLAGRVFGDAGHALTAFRTAEDTRESLQDRGITGRGAEAQALAAGAIDAALDIKGLDAIKGLKGLQQSGNLAKSIIGSAAIGGGEQAATSIINEAIDRIANKDKSNYAVNVQNYMAQGMSQKDAKDKAWSDEINTVLQEAGMGALVGTAMGTGGQVARKAANTLVDAATGRNIPSLWTPQTRTGEPVIDNAIRQSQDAAGEIERLANEIPKLTEEIAPERIIEDTNNAVNPENVVYHSGKLSRLNKAETRGKMSEGSRDTGYYGTGHYFVDSAHKTELDNGSGYGNKPYSSVDISKYDNLYRAATDQQASDLHDFSQKYTRYANKYNDKYYTDSDGNIDKTARAEYLSDLYNQFQRLFPEQTTSLEDFVTKLERYRNSENNVDISDRGDSVFTQFMKDMGYNGVDTRGTRSADTSRGVVIYDLDEDSVLQSNVTDADAKKGLMNNYVRNEGQPVFDADEDARIQNILDTQKRNADIQNAYRNLYDDTALRSAETDIERIQNEIDNLEKTARPHYEALLNDPDYLEREVNRQVRDFNTMGLEATEEETRPIIVDGAKESLAEIDTRLERLRQQLGETQAVINEETIKSKAALDQARASIENRVAAEKAEPNPTLTEKVDDITNHPRYVKPLEGEELNNANATIEQNTREINTIQQRIDAINKNPKNKRNGKLTKKAADEVKTLNSQKTVLNAENTALKKQIKGGITPVKDLLSDNAKKSLFGKFDSVYSDLYVAKKIAGETEQAKQLEKDARKNLGNYIESGDINDLKMFYGSAAELQELAERTGGKYVTKSGEYSYNDWFGTGTNKYTGETENLRLLDSIDNRIPYKELNSLNKTNIAAESAPVDRITENIEPPVTETPLDNVPPTNDEGIIPPNDGGNVPPIPPETPNLEYPDGGDRVRSFSRRGSQDETLPEEVRNILAEDTYKVVRNADVETRANELFDPENTAQTMSNLNRAVENHDPAAALLSYKLAKTYFDEGNYDAGLDAMEKVSAELTRSGQFTQAAKLAMMQNDPMASLRSYTRDLDRLNQWGNKKYKNKWNDLELSQEDIDLFNSVQKGDAEALSNVVDQLNSKFGKQIPANLWDKAVAASKTSMLLNMRTQGRNIVSNLAMLPLRSASDRVSALGQNIVHLINPDVKVTQSLTGGSKQQKEIATQIWDRLKDDITGENKMKDSVQSDILSHRQIFNDDWFAKWIDNITNGGVQRLNERLGGDANRSTMETLSNFTYWLMGDFGDTPFVKKNFVNRLASYMKAQGIDKVEDVPDDAIAIATQEALKATFKDDNAFSNALANVKKSTGKFGEVALPFVKTPANLAMRGIDYSPAGLVNTFRKLKSGAEASTVIDELAKNLTGTAMIYLGYKLRQNDLLSGSYSDDSDEKAWQKQQGMLENAIHIGDNYYTVDWAQPAATPLIIGSTIYDAINASDNDNNNVLDTVNTTYRGATAVANSWLNTSPLQSLSELLGGSDYSGSTAENIANTIIEFPQRFIPAQLGATARTIDPVMRDTYESDDTLTGILGNQTRQLQAKIPYLSRELPISYDTWGNPRTRSDSTAEAFFAQNLNPGQLGNKNETPIDAEIQRIFDATGDSGVFPWAAARSLDLGNDGKIKLTNEQHSEYQKTLGQLSYNLAEGIINSSEFKALSDDEKAETLNKAYKFANQVSKEDLFDHTTNQNKKLMAAYRENGVNGAVNYLVGKDTAEKKEEKPATPKTTTTKTNTVANTVPKMEQSKANDQKQQKQSSASDLGIKQDTYAKIGNKAGKNAEKVYNAIPSLKRNGLGSSSAYYTYADALSVDPNLSTADFIKTFNTIDADNSKGIKQDELISYFNSNNISQDQANKYWKMYGDSEWKKIPKLEDGKYKKVAK